MRNKGISKNIVKTNLINTNFIRVVNKNSLNEVINTNIYKEIKLTDDSLSYVQVLPEELPLNVVNSLSIGNSYEKMNENELQYFLRNSSISEEEVLKENSFTEFEFFKIDRCCNIDYLLTKQQEDFYQLQGVFLSEYGKIKALRQISPMELPYIIMDIIDKQGLEEFTALIAENIFFKLVKEDDKYLVVIYTVKDENKSNKKGESLLTIQTLTLYTIVIKDNEFILVNDVNDKLFFETNDIKIKKITDEFVKTIGLKED